MKSRQNHRFCAVLAGLVLAVGGCGQNSEYGKYSEEQMRQFQFANKYDLPEPSGDSMVLGVFSETITSDEILAITEEFLQPAAGHMDSDTFTSQAMPYVREAIKGKITDILLYQEARKTAPDTIDDMLDKAAETEVQKFVANYGNNYALAESKIKEMGMDWRTFREYQKKLLLTQSYLSKMIKVEKRFPQQQLEDYYDQNRQQFETDGRLSFSLIEIRPDALDAAQLQPNESAAAAAQRIALEVAGQLKNGADFAESAKAWHGNLAGVGGQVLPLTPGKQTLPEPYNSLEAHAIALEPGQIGDPVTLDGTVFIVRLDVYEAPECKSFYQVQNQIEQQMIYEEQQKQYYDLVNKLLIKTDIAQVDQFTEFCVQQAYGRWGQSS